MDERSLEVLALANEDHSGLYEVVWAFRARFMPDADEAELIAAAAAAVQAMLDCGYVRLVRFRLEPEQEVAEVPVHELASVLRSADSWRPPKSWEDPYPSVVATEAGERALLRQPD